MKPRLSHFSLLPYTSSLFYPAQILKIIRNIITSVILFIAQMQSCEHRLEAEQLIYFLSKPCYAEIAVDNLP